MSAVSIPHAFRSIHLEGRSPEPLRWKAPTEESASEVAHAVHAMIEEGHLGSLFTVTRAGLFVRVERNLPPGVDAEESRG